MININSNIHIIPTKKSIDCIGQIMEETGMAECLHRGKWLLVDLDPIGHGEFCGAGEYFIDPKGVA